MMKHNNDHRNNNKVFASPKLVAKETSVGNSSCRVYYGAAAGAVPFMWESQPGTPKHTLSETSLPPLTPPPSYSVNTNPKHYSSSTIQRSGARAKALLDSIIPRALKFRKAGRNMSPTSSSVSWSSSSSSSWSSTSKGTQKPYNSVSRVPFGYDDEDEDEDIRRSGSPTSTLCFGIKRRGSEFVRSCSSVRKIKFAFMSIASHDQSRRDRTA
uniref:uncharacterized protein LOC105353079 n=1 Tax=Fragaria vesca subsp. vesca TaxID=101020 RepID=UPI0005CAEA94|nr:PREDICTED: uncharacterized protein LOC105353079 [Fragaria vesca subsp. vesca]